MQLVSDKESVRTKSTEDYSVMNTIAYNLQKFINSYKNPYTGKKCNTQVAINVHLPAKLYSCGKAEKDTNKTENDANDKSENNTGKKTENNANKSRMR